MQTSSSSRSRLAALLQLGGACALALLASARADQPKITLIEPFLASGVLIHFDMDASRYRYYQVQYTETLSNGVPGGTWTNLLNQPVSSDDGHFTALDTRMRPQRFYRLIAYP